MRTHFPLVEEHTNTNTRTHLHTPTHTHMCTHLLLYFFLLDTVYTTSHTQTIHYFKCYLHPYSVFCNKPHFPIVYVYLRFANTYIIVWLCIYIIFSCFFLFIYAGSHTESAILLWDKWTRIYVFFNAVTNTQILPATHLSTKKCIAYIFVLL